MLFWAPGSPPCVYLASYPGLLTPAIVTCSTNVGKTVCKWAHYRSQLTWTMETAEHSTPESLGCTEGICCSSAGTSLYMIRFTRPSPTLVLQATNTGVRRPGYEATVYPLYYSFLVSYNSPKSVLFHPTPYYCTILLLIIMHYRKYCMCMGIIIILRQCSTEILSILGPIIVCGMPS